MPEGLCGRSTETKAHSLCSPLKVADPGRPGGTELDASLNLRPVQEGRDKDFTAARAPVIPSSTLRMDAASVVFTVDAGKVWRLPKGKPGLGSQTETQPVRVDREVVTERDLFNAFGTFYELPADNAGGFAKIRPIATHNRHIHDFCSYRGLLILTGIRPFSAADNPHVRRSEDGKAAVWAGAIDDLWKMGKPRGVGGPWKETEVTPGRQSDPYLMTGYDKKTLFLSHDAPKPITMDLEVDITGEGNWVSYQRFVVSSGQKLTHRFPDAIGLLGENNRRRKLPGYRPVPLRVDGNIVCGCASLDVKSFRCPPKTSGCVLLGLQEHFTALVCAQHISVAAAQVLK